MSSVEICEWVNEFNMLRKSLKVDTLVTVNLGSQPSNSRKSFIREEKDKSRIAIQAKKKLTDEQHFIQNNSF